MPLVARLGDRDSRGDTIVQSSRNVYAGSLTTGGAVVAQVEQNLQPDVSPVDAAEMLNDDPDSDPVYQEYQNQVYGSQGIQMPAPPGTQAAPGQPQQSIAETAAPPTTPPPANLPSDCSDIVSHQGPFPGSFQLSPNFTLAMLTTNTAISNYPLKAQNGLSEQQIVCNLRALCINVLEPMKQRHGAAMRINSGFRHGAGTSQHNSGQACDVSFTDLSGTDAHFVRAKDVQDTYNYDQFIYEQNNSIWYHVSYTTGKNRRMVMSKPRGNTYIHSLVKIITA